MGCDSTFYIALSKTPLSLKRRFCYHVVDPVECLLTHSTYTMMDHVSNPKCADMGPGDGGNMMNKS
jgi:hypothetical protein